MKLTPRIYRGPEDFHYLDDVLIAGWHAQIQTHYVHPGDIRWWLYYTFPGEENWSNIYLWEDESCRVAGWTLFSLKEKVFDLFVRPECYATPEMKEMLAWSAARMMELARAAGVAAVDKDWILPVDSFQIAVLEELGFKRAADRLGVHMVCPLDGPLPEPQLPPGFQVRGVRSLEELESRAAAQHSAFESDLPLERYLERFRHYMTSAVYVPEQDVVVEAPDGAIAAFARLWPNASVSVGNFEPVGVHAGYQRRGLGRAVMLEGLRRLQTWGMKAACLGTGQNNTPAVRLYESVGFHIESQMLVYRREV
jgi:ribosomal protein S18 acetylase RimI-like enzyme